MSPVHALRSLRGLARREAARLLRQPTRLLASVVRPTLWLIVFGAGFNGSLGVSIVPPYETYILYRDYMVPGLIGIILLFNGMLSSLALVHDRETGVMKVILTSPLPRWWLLFSKLLAGTLLSVLLVYAFLAAALLFDARIPWAGWLTILPAVLASGLMLGSVGLLLSVRIRLMENFAGAMNFVIFPMFFVSSALFPLWKLQEAGEIWLWRIAEANPFTHAVELIRFAAYGRFAAVPAAVVAGTAAAAFLAAVAGYDPARGLLRRRRPAA